MFRRVIFLLWAYKADHSQHWLIILHKSQKGQKKYHSTSFLIIFYSWLLAFFILSFPIFFSCSQESLCSPPTGVYHDEIKAAREKNLCCSGLQKVSLLSSDHRYKPYNLERGGGNKTNQTKPKEEREALASALWNSSHTPLSLSFVPLSVMLRNRRPL